MYNYYLWNIRNIYDELIINILVFNKSENGFENKSFEILYRMAHEFL